MTKNKKRINDQEKISKSFDKNKALSLYYEFLNYIEEGEYENFKLARNLFADPISW